MKNFLFFSIEGDIEELKTSDNIIEPDKYKYNYIDTIIDSKYNYIILYNNDTNEKKNLTFLPFYKKNIYGPFLLFAIDKNNNIKSLTQKKFLQLVSKTYTKLQLINAMT